jgi:ribosomal protein S12 methylthiotransferase
VFKYENVEGASSRDLPGHVDQDDIDERYDRFMEVQTALAHARSQAMIGRCVEAICDGWDEDAEAYAFRTKADAPEIDGVVYVDSDEEIAPGTIIQLQIVAGEGHELAGRPLEGRGSSMDRRR